MAVLITLYVGTFAFFWLRSPSHFAFHNGVQYQVVDFEYNRFTWHTGVFWIPARWFMESVVGYRDIGVCSARERTVLYYARTKHRVRIEDLRKALLGKWMHEGGDFVSLASDGGFSSSWTNTYSPPTQVWGYQGTWTLNNDVLVFTVTNRSSGDSANMEKDTTEERWRLITVNDGELVSEFMNQTNTFYRRLIKKKRK